MPFGSTGQFIANNILRFVLLGTNTSRPSSTWPSARMSSCTYEKTTCRLLQNPLPTPYWGFQPSGFTVQAITKSIQATPQEVLDALVNTKQYPQWNNFVPKIIIQGVTDSLNQGVRFTEHVDMFGNGKPSGLIKINLRVSILEQFDTNEASTPGEGFRMVWLNTLSPTWILRSERVHHIYQGNDSEGTTYECFETFSGLFGWVTKVIYGGILVKRFAQWNEECRMWVERDNQIATH